MCQRYFIFKTQFLFLFQNNLIDQMDRYRKMLEEGQKIEEKDVKIIIDKVKEVLMGQPNLVKVRAPVTVCGDIHGQFYDLLEIFQVSGTPPNTNYLFMGDYVDRGSMSIQCFLYLIILKIKHPGRITILRGNHQNKQINKLYGFYDECLAKYGTQQVWKLCSDIFHYLPLSAVIDNKILCLHGGLCPNIQNLDQINTINRVQDIPQKGALCDLLWSDPSDKANGYQVSPRGAGFQWGQDVSEKFTYRNNLSLICRGHQLVMDGFNQMHKKLCVTLFSAPNYCNRCGNQGCILQIDDKCQLNYQKYDSSPYEDLEKPTRRVPDYFL